MRTITEFEVCEGNKKRFSIHHITCFVISFFRQPTFPFDISIPMISLGHCYSIRILCIEYSSTLRMLCYSSQWGNPWSTEVAENISRSFFLQLVKFHSTINEMDCTRCRH